MTDIKNQLLGKLILDLCSIHVARNDFCSIYFGRKPTIYVKDPEMIKQITITESECFIDRPVSAHSRITLTSNLLDQYYHKHGDPRF